MQKKTITKPLLRNLNDNCGGGFILFTLDEEGLPVMDSNFDSNPEALALQLYVQNWAKAMETAGVEQMVQGIIGSPKEDDPEGGEEEI